ncbi:MAG TPA: hypothetical protein VG499_12535 [Actinomycetota bacterium]|nr:hypothetical protein [Actinomycetota bacterium]
MRTTFTRALVGGSSSSSSTTTAQNSQSTQRPGQNGYGPGSGSAPADCPERGSAQSESNA